MTLRLRRATNAALNRIQAKLDLPDRSATLRFLVHEKDRELGGDASGEPSDARAAALQR